MKPLAYPTYYSFCPTFNDLVNLITRLIIDYDCGHRKQFKVKFIATDTDCSNMSSDEQKKVFGKPKYPFGVAVFNPFHQDHVFVAVGCHVAVDHLTTFIVGNDVTSMYEVNIRKRLTDALNTELRYNDEPARTNFLVEYK